MKDQSGNKFLQKTFLKNIAQYQYQFQDAVCYAVSKLYFWQETSRSVQNYPWFFDGIEPSGLKHLNFPLIYF